LLGLAVGATTVLLVQRLREVVEEEDAEAIANRLSQQLQELEARATGEAAAAKRKKKPSPAT
jgi:hypothetical protein